MSLELQHRGLPPCKGYSAGPEHTDTGLGGPTVQGLGTQARGCSIESGHTDRKVGSGTVGT